VYVQLNKDGLVVGLSACRYNILLVLEYRHYYQCYYFHLLLNLSSFLG